MKRIRRELSSAWPYATVTCCLFVTLAFLDGNHHDWGWVLSDSIAATFWFLLAHHSWEQS